MSAGAEPRSKASSALPIIINIANEIITEKMASNASAGRFETAFKGMGERGDRKSIMLTYCQHQSLYHYREPVYDNLRFSTIYLN